MDWLENLPQPVTRVLGAPLPLRKLAAQGAAPGLRPADALLVVAVLAHTADEPELREQAAATLAAPRKPLLDAAFAAQLDPRVGHALAQHNEDQQVLAQLVAHTDTALDTLLTLARSGSEALSERIATNEQRLLAAPALIEALYKNPNTRMSTADRIVQLAIFNKIELDIPAFREICLALEGELIAEASDEPSPDDEAFKACGELAVDELPAGDLFEPTDTGEELIRPPFVEQKVAFDKLTVSARIRRAQLGKASDRSQALRDGSPLVRRAAAKSALLTESEVLQITHNRNSAEDVLRTLGLDREWTRSHQVKLNLVMNPRTPYDLASRFMTFLRDHELRQVANSKDIPGAVVKQAKLQLERKRR